MALGTSMTSSFRFSLTGSALGISIGFSSTGSGTGTGMAFGADFSSTLIGSSFEKIHEWRKHNATKKTTIVNLFMAINVLVKVSRCPYKINKQQALPIINSKNLLSV